MVPNHARYQLRYTRIFKRPIIIDDILGIVKEKILRRAFLRATRSDAFCKTRRLYSGKSICKEVFAVKQGKVVVASAAFVGLALTKMLFPDFGEGVRTRLHAALERDPDYVAAFRDLGRRLSLQKDGTDGQKAATVSAAPARFISYYVEEATVRGDQEGEEPAEVAAFLERQAAYADLALPENVDYAYEALPFSFAAPVAGRQSSGFGYRLHPILDTVRFHYGTDVAAGAGETIGAFADGTVCFSGYDESFGWHIKIDHGGGWVSHYCHCSALLVKEGDAVSIGEAVARVGATGLATGPHLHFELTRSGVYVNPEYYINV